MELSSKRRNGRTVWIVTYQRRGLYGQMRTYREEFGTKSQAQIWMKLHD